MSAACEYCGKELVRFCSQHFGKQFCAENCAWPWAEQRIQSLDEQLRAATDEIDRQIMLVDAARELSAHRLEQLASLKGESQ